MVSSIHLNSLTHLDYHSMPIMNASVLIFINHLNIVLLCKIYCNFINIFVYIVRSHFHIHFINFSTNLAFTYTEHSTSYLKSFSAPLYVEAPIESTSPPICQYLDVEVHMSFQSLILVLCRCVKYFHHN